MHFFRHSAICYVLRTVFGTAVKSDLKTCKAFSFIRSDPLNVKLKTFDCSPIVKILHQQ